MNPLEWMARMADHMADASKHPTTTDERSTPASPDPAKPRQSSLDSPVGRPVVSLSKTKRGSSEALVDLQERTPTEIRSPEVSWNLARNGLEAMPGERRAPRAPEAERLGGRPVGA